MNATTTARITELQTEAVAHYERAQQHARAAGDLVECSPEWIEQMRAASDLYARAARDAAWANSKRRAAR